MATRITNVSGAPFPLPAIYGGGTLLDQVPKNSAIIADTPANVAAALGSPPSTSIRLDLVPDGQPGAITPSSSASVGVGYSPGTPGDWSSVPTNVGAALDEAAAEGAGGGHTLGGDLAGTLPNPTIGSGKVTSAKLASGAASANIGTLTGDLSGSTLPATTIAAGAVSSSKLASGAASANIGTLTGDLNGSTLPATTIAAGAVSSSKLASGAASANIGTLSGDLSGSVLPAANIAAASKPVLGASRQVRLVATGNLSLNGAATIDGVAVVTGDRVLAAGQTVASQNGIWIANTAGAWTQASDWATGAVVGGMRTFVSEGTAWANTDWVLTTSGAITVGSTALAFYPRIQKGTSAAMSSGTTTISNVWLKAGAQILLTVNTAGGTQGVLAAASASRTAGAGNGSFVISSSSGSDSSTVDWAILNV